MGQGEVVAAQGVGCHGRADVDGGAGAGHLLLRRGAGGGLEGERPGAVPKVGGIIVEHPAIHPADGGGGVAHMAADDGVPVGAVDYLDVGEIHLRQGGATL